MTEGPVPDTVQDAATTLGLVPVPRSSVLSGGPDLHLGPGTRVEVTDRRAEGVATGVARLLAAALGHAVPVRGSAADEVAGAGEPTPTPVILLLTEDRALLDLASDVDDARAAGAYRLEVTADGARITALDPAGLVHGAATLAQAVGRDTSADPPGAHDGATTALAPAVVPSLVVTDVPRFGWRGLSLDVARHFFGVETVVAVLDLLAGLRLNTLHLHLTDDQGWRLEVPSRPLLTERSGGTAVDGDPAGFYTADDWTRIVRHAATLGITVVPEVDLPGHVNAALHAYGELTPSGEPTDAYTGIEVGFSRLHADLPTTDPFLRDVLTDVAAMTPGAWVHIGGDEVHTMTAAEHAELVALAAGHVRAAGKGVVGWQEAAHADLPSGSLIQYWDHQQPADDVVAAVGRGARLVLSPGRRVYLDMKYDPSSPLGLEWAGHIELRDAYDWDPLAIVPGVAEPAIAGIEAALWSETLRDVDDVMTMLLPRLAAVAEVAWTDPALRDWEGFARRVPALAARWSADGLAWHRSPQVRWPEE